MANCLIEEPEVDLIESNRIQRQAEEALRLARETVCLTGEEFFLRLPRPGLCARPQEEEPDHTPALN